MTSIRIVDLLRGVFSSRWMALAGILVTGPAADQKNSYWAISVNEPFIAIADDIE